MILQDNLHPKIKETIKTFLIDNVSKASMPFYAHFNLMLNFVELKSVGTCGVNISSKGMNFYYNPEFINQLTQKEFNFVNIHELFHLLFDHPNRTVLGSFNKKMSNVVQDMIINHLIWTEIDKKFIEIPKIYERKDEEGKILNESEIGRNATLFIPKDYKGPIVFEHLYQWVSQQKQERDEKKEKDKGNQPGKSDKGEGTKNKEYGSFGKGDVDCYSLEHIFDNMDKGHSGSYLDQHIDDDIPYELREAMINEMMHTMRSRGLTTSSNESVIGKLQKKRKDYLREIKKSLSNEIFGNKKTKTISKPNRRGIDGLKGNKKIRPMINCLLDVSGSMNKLQEKVLNYIFRNDISINLIQVDTQIKNVQTIKSMKELQNIKSPKSGGTRLMPGVIYVKENFNQYNTVILTDGYCDNLELSDLKGQVLIISAGIKCKIANGKCKQILVDENN